MSKKKVNVSEHYRKVNIDYNDKNNRFKREYVKIILFAFFLLSIVVGASYALFTNTLYGKENVEVTSGTFKIDFKDGNIINLDNSSPISDVAGLQTTPYTFVVNNTGSLDAKYNISLEEKDNGVDALDRKYVKYSLKEGDGEWSHPALLSNGLTLTANKLLSSGKNETFQLKIWLDEAAPNEVQGKKYGAKIVINAVQTNSNLINISIPIININGNSEINIEEGATFTDPGVGEVKGSDGNKIDISKVSTRYEYFDGENAVTVDRIDTSKIGIYYIYYELFDNDGNVLTTTVRTVNVYHKDKIPPTISLIGDEIINLKYGEEYQEYGAMASDNEGGNLTDKIIIFGEVNSKKDGTYLIKYFVRDNTGNLASVTRTVIVGKKTGKVESNIEEIIDDKDSTEAGIKIDTKVDSDTDIDKVTYAITTTKEKPANKDFKTLEELEKMGKYKDGKFVILENGTYYIWIRDEKGNVTNKKFTISNIDETKPECVMDAPKYVGVDAEQDITISCTDVVGIKKSYLTDKMFNIDNSNVSISSISAPEEINGGYQYVVTITGKKTGESKISLKKDSIFDNARNGNTEISTSVKVSQITLSESKTTLDVSTNPTYKIKVSGVNYGKLMYTGYDKDIIKVSSDGVVTALKPGSTSIVVVEKNGYASATLKVDISNTLTATFHKNGNGVKSISKDKLTCVLTKDNPEECSIDAPSFEVLDGYTALGWNIDKNAHEGSMKVTLRDHTDFYTISKKDEVIYSAIFYANGATLSDGEDTSTTTIVKSCSLPEVYNNDTQITSCDIVTPTITGSLNTPIVLGYSKGKSDSTKPDLLMNTTLSLNKDLDGTNYFAITKNNPITYQVSYKKNGAGVLEISKENDSCTIPSTYNGIKQDTSCTVTAPSISVSSGFSAIGWNFDATSHKSVVKNGAIEISEDSILYAISRKDSLTYKANFHKSGLGVESINATTDSCIIPEVYNNEVQDTKCKINLPGYTIKDGFEGLGWSQNKDSTEKAGGNDDTALNGYRIISDGVWLDHDNTDLYVISRSDSYYISINVSANGAKLSSEQKLTCVVPSAYNNTKQDTTCNVDMPEIIRDNFEIYGFSMDKDVQDEKTEFAPNNGVFAISKNEDGKTFYAITKRLVTTTWDGNGANTSKTLDSCEIWNNRTTCRVTTPEITRDSYEILGWKKIENDGDNNSTTADVGVNTSIDVSEDYTYSAITRKKITATFNKNGAVTQTNEQGEKVTDEKVTRSCIRYNKMESCTVTSPDIEADSNTPVKVHYQNVKDENDTWDYNTDKEISSDVEYKAITKNNPITYYVTYQKNGVGVTKIGKESDSCTIPSTYNGKEQNTSCTVDAPTIDVESGYTAIGWDFDATSHNSAVKNGKITITNDSVLYAISRKDSITYTANFHKNGVGVSKISSTNDSCTIPEVFNNEVQDTKCKIGLPTITVTGLYYELGWSQDKEATTKAINSDDTALNGYREIDDGVYLDHNTDLYSISKKDQLDLSAEFYENGTTLIGEKVVSCTLKEVYNNEVRVDNCVLDVPTIQRDNFDIIGYSTNPNGKTNDDNIDMKSHQINIDKNNNGNKYYAISKRKIDITYDKNGATSLTKDSDTCTIWNSATSCEITTPEIIRDSFEIYGYSTDKDATSESDDLVPHNSKYSVDENHKYYAITSKYIEDKFYINGALGLTDVAGKIVNTDVSRSCTIYNRETKCSITTPAIAASYNTPDIVGFTTKSNATVKDLDPNQTIDVTDKVDYYAITKKDAITYSTLYHKDGIGVTAIEKTTDSCTIPTVYNGMKQDDYCTVTLPNISVENDQYEALGWSQNADAQQEVLSNDYSAVNGYMGIGQKIRLDKNISLTSIVRKKTITLKGYFYRNGAKSLTYSSNGRIVDSTDDVVTVTCDLEATYNNHKQATSCSITSPIINASENTPEVIGFANNSTDILKSLDPNKVFDITSDVTYYAITKKSSITLNANFNANNSTISDTAEKRCTLKETYNGNKQDTTCSVTPPKVTASSNTPDFLGWNLNNNDKKNNTNYNLDNNGLTLSEDISGNTWYAITEKKEVYYNVNYKIGDHVKNISKDSGRCKIDATYNGEVQTKTCIIGEKDTENNPVITADVGYTSLGWSQLKGTTVGSPVVVLTKDNMTFYANASANHYNIEFYTDDHIYHTISATYDEAFTLPTIKSISLTKRGYTFKKWISEGVDYADGVKVGKNLASEEGAKVRFDAVWSDEEKPVCRFTTIGSTTTLNTTTARLECTDTGSGVVKTTLQPSDFSVSDARVGKVVSVASPVEMTDGYYWDLTVQGLSVGSFDITFGANKVSDSNQHYPHEITTKNFNNQVTSTSKVNVAGRVYSVNYTKGNYVSGISSTTGSCTTTGSNIACNVVLPGITANRGYTVSGWSNGSTITPVGENYELNENNTSYSGQPTSKQTLTLTAVAKDITPPTCSISENTSNWTQSAILSISASDEGSGLANDAYSWTSKTTGFTSSNTTTVNKNTTYTAYVKDKDGNVGNCSKTVSNIDTTKPVCTFDNPSDTTIVSGNTATVKLSCTDTQGGITDVSRNLSANSFSITNSSGATVSYAKIKSVSAPTAITSGYSYDVTIQGVSYGDFVLNLLSDNIIDAAGNANNRVTSNSMTAYNKAEVGTCNPGLIYNGEPQTLASGGTGISFSNNSRIDHDSQRVTMTPTTGYMFSDEASSKTTDCSISKRSVTFKANDSLNIPYDGNEHTNHSASVTDGSLVNGHTASFTFDSNSKLTNVGSVSNVITAVVIKDSSSNVVTTNYDVKTTNGTLQVIKSASTNPTLTAYSGTYDAKPHSIGVSGGSGGTIKYSTDKSTWSTENPTVTDATNSGAVTVYVKVFGDSNHNDSSIISSTITIYRASSSISFTSRGGTYSGSVIGATASGLGSITYTYYSDSGCKTAISTPIDAGTYYVQAKSAGDGNHYGATSSCSSHVISKKQLTVSWKSGDTFTYDGKEHSRELTSSALTGVNSETVNLTTSGKGVNASDSEYTTTASISSVTGGRAKASNYSLTNSAGKFKINKASSTTTFKSTGGTYSGSAIGATASGYGSITYTYYSDSGCKTAISTPIDAGTYYVKAKSAGDGNHYGATSSCSSHVISKKQLTVSWDSTSSFTYDGKEHSRALAATKLTGVNSETVNLTTSGKGVNASDSEYTTTASISSVTGGRAKTSNYSLSNSSAKFKINKAGSTTTFTSTGGTYSGSAIGATASGYGSITYTYYSDSGCKTAISTPIDAGTYYVKAKSAGDGNHYGATSSCSSHVISKKQLTVSWKSGDTFTYDGKEHSRELTSSALTGVNSETVNLTKSGTGVNASDTEYTTTASISSVTGGRANKNNYSLSNSSAKFKINKATPTISMDTISSPIVGTTQTYHYYYNGNGTVSCSSYSTETATCSVNTTNKTVTLKYIKTGWNKIILSATSTTNYNSASTSAISFTVLGATRTATVYANGNTLSTPGECSASGSNRICSCTSSGTSTSCNVTLPTVSNSTTPSVCGYSGSSSPPGNSSCSISSGATITLSSSPSYYAQTYKNSKTYKASFEKASTGISSIGSNSLSCSIPAVYNGTAQESSCNITLPSITVATGYASPVWRNTQNLGTDLQPNTSKSISDDTSFIATATVKVPPTISILSQSGANTLDQFSNYTNNSGCKNAPYTTVSVVIKPSLSSLYTSGTHTATLKIGGNTITTANISNYSSTSGATSDRAKVEFQINCGLTVFYASTGKVTVDIPYGVFVSTYSGAYNKATTLDTGYSKTVH